MQNNKKEKKIVLQNPSVSQTNDLQDILYIDTEQQETYTFHPVNTTWQLKHATSLKLSIMLTHEFNSSEETIESPSTIHRIIGDGNCFFRCISFMITGTENFHSNIRHITVNHMKKLHHRMEMILPPGTTTMKYLSTSHMAKPPLGLLM